MNRIEAYTFACMIVSEQHPVDAHQLCTKARLWSRAQGFGEVAAGQSCVLGETRGGCLAPNTFIWA